MKKRFNGISQLPKTGSALGKRKYISTDKEEVLNPSQFMKVGAKVNVQRVNIDALSSVTNSDFNNLVAFMLTQVVRKMDNSNTRPFLYWDVKNKWIIIPSMGVEIDLMEIGFDLGSLFDSIVSEIIKQAPALKWRETKRSNYIKLIETQVGDYILEQRGDLMICSQIDAPVKMEYICDIEQLIGHSLSRLSKKINQEVLYNVLTFDVKIPNREKTLKFNLIDIYNELIDKTNDETLTDVVKEHLSISFDQSEEWKATDNQIVEYIPTMV